MSIHSLKLKGVARFGSKISGKSPGEIWQSRGPFGSGGFQRTAGSNGFSINGGRRNVGYVGQSMAMSRNGTPYFGKNPMGQGSHFGRYNHSRNNNNQVVQSVFNAARAEILGNQYLYIKPSVISNKGMLETKYKWIHGGQYPNYWVQPVYGNDSLSHNASQQVYIDRKIAANTCANDTNKQSMYVNYKSCGVGPRGGASCIRRPANYKFVSISSQTGYTKTLRQPQTSEQRTKQIQKNCSNPNPKQAPFPPAVSTRPSGIGRTFNNGVTGPPAAIRRIDLLRKI